MKLWEKMWHNGKPAKTKFGELFPAHHVIYYTDRWTYLERASEKLGGSVITHVLVPYLTVHVVAHTWAYTTGSATSKSHDHECLGGGVLISLFWGIKLHQHENLRGIVDIVCRRLTCWCGTPRQSENRKTQYLCYEGNIILCRHIIYLLSLNWGLCCVENYVWVKRSCCIPSPSLFSAGLRYRTTGCGFRYIATGCV